MSDSNSGWWQASDGKWYPPETKPGGAVNTQVLTVPKAPSDGKGFAITSLVFAILSLLLFPVLFGPLGVVFGSIAWSKGSKFGMVSTLVTIPCMYFGMLFGMIVWSAV